MASVCDGCGKKKSPTAVVCPHCGAADPKHDPRDPELARSKRSRAAERPPVSAAESASLLATGSDRPAFWSHFLRPSPTLSGGWVLVDLALIALTLPLVAGLVFSLLDGRSRDGVGTVSGHYFESIIIALLGGVVFVVTSWSFDAFEFGLAIVGVASVALMLRVFLRHWA